MLFRTITPYNEDELKFIERLETTITRLFQQIDEVKITLSEINSRGIRANMNIYLYAQGKEFQPLVNLQSYWKMYHDPERSCFFEKYIHDDVQSVLVRL